MTDKGTSYNGRFVQWCRKCNEVDHSLDTIQLKDSSGTVHTAHKGCGCDVTTLAKWNITHECFDKMSQNEIWELTESVRADLQRGYDADRAKLNACIDKSLAETRAKIAAQNIGKPKCPTCGSYEVSKITPGSRMVSVFTLGLASSSIGKQFKCKKCGYKW